MGFQQPKLLHFGPLPFRFNESFLSASISTNTDSLSDCYRRRNKICPLFSEGGVVVITHGGVLRAFHKCAAATVELLEQYRIHLSSIISLGWCGMVND